MQDDIQYYLDNYNEPDFVENETLYDDLDLTEEDLYDDFDDKTGQFPSSFFFSLVILEASGP